MTVHISLACPLGSGLWSSSDEWRQAVEQGGGGMHDANDIFSAFFGGGGMGRRQQRGPKKGEDRE